MPSKMKKRTSVARTRSTPKKTSARVSGRGKTTMSRSKKAPAKRPAASKAKSKAKSTASRARSSARSALSRAKTKTGTAARRTSNKTTRAKTGKTSKARSTASRTRSGKSASRSSSRPKARSSGSKRTGSKKSAKSGRSGSSAVTTTDHNRIRKWVESRGGTPTTVAGTERGAETAGLLRIDFPGYSGKGSLEKVPWDDFFEKFEESNLAFLYDSDKGSKFNKFVQRGAGRGKR